jgi:hypothetical protein
MKGRKGNKYAKGGGVHVINGAGSPIMASAKKTTSSGFKRGGKVTKLKAGGAVEGVPSAPRLDKRARGGRMGSPYSSASAQSNRASGNKGHEDSP